MILTREIGVIRQKHDIILELFDVDEKGNNLFRAKIFGKYQYFTTEELEEDFVLSKLWFREDI